MPKELVTVSVIRIFTNVSKSIVDVYISKNKGIFELLDAIKILNQNRKDSIKLLFCGELNDPIEEIPDNCIYLGPLDYLNAMKLLIGANLLILPSKSESHPRVIIESIIYDIPFLTTRGVAEIEKYFPDNILDNTEPEYLAQRIKDCFDDCDASLSTSYPIHIHQIDNVIDQIYKVYDNLIS